MSTNSNAILTLCSHLCVGEGVVPLEPKEWAELAKKLLDVGLQPADIFDISKIDFKDKLSTSAEFTDRIFRLIDRNASLTFELTKLNNIGVSAITRADSEYPTKLKKVLGNNCPPIFYVAGDVGLLKNKYVGYVGSRTISDEDISFTRDTVAKTVLNGYGVVTGGAKGVDTISEEQALNMGAPVVEYLSDSMLRKLKKSNIINAIRNGQMLLLSVVKPDAGFNVGVAMMRNRYIYAQSSGTIVVKSEYNKGGTWAGATENLQHGWCKQICWNKISYPGNKALLEKGAIPIDITWDGVIDNLKETTPFSDSEQLSLFD